MKKRILCYGDSNTWGYKPVTGERYDEDERFTGVLARELGEDYRVVEEGLVGRTTVFSDRMEPERNRAPAAIYPLAASAGLHGHYAGHQRHQDPFPCEC